MRKRRDRRRSSWGRSARPPKKRKAHTEPDDPYAPLGVHAGAFTLFPAIELIGGYDTNPARAPGGQGASLYTVAPELQAQSNWSRHELKADLRGSYTGYSPDATPTLSRPNVNGKVDGRIDVTRDTRIDLGGRVLVVHRQSRQPESAGRASPSFRSSPPSAAAPASASASIASNWRSRAMPSAPSTRIRRSPTAAPPAMRIANTINMAARCAAATN